MKNVQAKVLEVIALYGVPTSAADVRRICEAQEIELHTNYDLGKQIFGYIAKYREKLYIIISSAVEGNEWFDVAFHELGHHFMGHKFLTGKQFFAPGGLKQNQKNEDEAHEFSRLMLEFALEAVSKRGRQND
jgi:Zn-dependent peptidase ImmA (M78 family)